MELSPEIVATGLAAFLRSAGLNIADPPAPRMPERPPGLLRRIPAFCAGCPHGTSTRLPEGSFATAGIGCHFMALDESDQTRTFTHMGGEGAPFVGMAPFTDTPHVFANMGDGTYTHSGIMAIRQAVAAGTRITYKLLVNDAVAMTGGQPAEGNYSVAQYAAQIAAEGVARIALVADDEDRLPPASALPPGTTRHVRAELDAVQRELRDYDGVSVLIYDQVCATEKRRRRKRGKLAQPVQSVVINEAGVRELRRLLGAVELHRDRAGGDLARPQAPHQSDQLQRRSVVPEGLLPELRHRRRPAERAGCRSALAGARGRVRRRPAAAGHPRHDKPWRALFAGIGGGGIVTSGAILAMAAHLEGKVVRTLDFTGLAQKNGTVVAHVQIADDEAALDVVRIPLGTADVMIAADLAVGVPGPACWSATRATAAVIGNLDLAATAAFKHDANLLIDAVLHRRTIERATDAAASVYLHAVRLAEHLFGNAQAMNTMLLGLAWQRGLIPVGEAAILRAIELNGAAVSLNRRAFLWGRILAERPALEDEILVHTLEAPPATLEALIEARAAALVAYQNAALANRYRALVNEVIARETAGAGRAWPPVARRGRRACIG